MTLLWGASVYHRSVAMHQASTWSRLDRACVDVRDVSDMHALAAGGTVDATECEWQVGGHTLEQQCIALKAHLGRV